MLCSVHFRTNPKIYSLNSVYSIALDCITYWIRWFYPSLQPAYSNINCYTFLHPYGNALYRIDVSTSSLFPHSNWKVILFSDILVWFIVAGWLGVWMTQHSFPFKALRSGGGGANREIEFKVNLFLSEMRCNSIEVSWSLTWEYFFVFFCEFFR